MQKNKILKISLLLACIFLISCKEDNVQSIETSPTFSALIESGNLSGLNLTIYYINPIILTSFPLSVDGLINFNNVSKIVVSSDRLEEHIDLLRQISNAALVPVEREVYLNTRLCYVFETEKDGRVFEIAMGGVQTDENGEYIGSCMFANGHAVIVDDVFYDVLLPFLTEDTKKDLEIYFNRGNQENATDNNE